MNRRSFAKKIVAALAGIIGASAIKASTVGQEKLSIGDTVLDNEGRIAEVVFLCKDKVYNILYGDGLIICLKQQNSKGYYIYYKQAHVLKRVTGSNIKKI